jgi:succinate-semialdehyde dehydrogenase/glutarate-semialdehyde dehydrogenase
MAIETLNPTTGELVQSFPEMSKAEVDKILDAAVAAQKAWARVPIAERAVPMRKVAALLRERAQELGASPPWRWASRSRTAPPRP